MKKKIKNSQPQTKFTGSYKKRVYWRKLIRPARAKFNSPKTCQLGKTWKKNPNF